VFGKHGPCFLNFFLGDLENLFLGKDKDKEREFETEQSITNKTNTASSSTSSGSGSSLSETGIGTQSSTDQTTEPIETPKDISKVEVPIDDDDLDGQPMQLNLLSSSYDSDKEEDEEDVDGTPLDSNSEKNMGKKRKIFQQRLQVEEGKR